MSRETIDEVLKEAEMNQEDYESLLKLSIMQKGSEESIDNGIWVQFRHFSQGHTYVYNVHETDYELLDKLKNEVFQDSDEHTKYS